MSKDYEDPTETSWKYQLSLKLGRNSQDMLNIRADDMTSLVEACRLVASNAVELLAPGAAFAPVAPPLMAAPAATLPQEARPAPAATPASPAPVQAATGQEIGPVTYARIEHTDGANEQTGRPWTRHKVVFSNGLTASTFDALVADVASKLIGKPVYAMVQKSGKYYDLLNVRPAA